MNLTMPAAEVDSLVTRGQEAAKKLVARFGDGSNPTPAQGWENQRWLRFRTATAGLSDWLVDFSGGYSRQPAPPATPYSSLAGAGAGLRCRRIRSTPPTASQRTPARPACSSWPRRGRRFRTTSSPPGWPHGARCCD